MEYGALAGFACKLDRSIFLDNKNKSLASLDRPLSIGHGQTISQPSLVLMMTWHLRPEKASTVLEIGTGSGYQTAILAEFSGRVYTIERVPELAEKARVRLEALGYSNIEYRLGDGSEGWPEKGPFDRILAAAAARKLPDKLVMQLKCGGRMVIPVGPQGMQELLLVRKDANGNAVIETLGAVTFVEFTGEYGWQQ